MIPQNSNREVSVGTFLTVGAINRAVNPKSKDGIGPWMKKTVLPRLLGQKASAFDSQSFWDAMDLVKKEDISRIEERAWKKVLELYQIFTDILFYDTTNFATHMDSLTPSELLQRGKPKKGGRSRGWWVLPWQQRRYWACHFFTMYMRVIATMRSFFLRR